VTYFFVQCSVSIRKNCALRQAVDNNYMKELCIRVYFVTKLADQTTLGGTRSNRTPCEVSRINVIN